MPVYIKKYTGSNYFIDRNFVDSIILTQLPAETFPIFRYETEDNAGIASYRAGDFDLMLSLTDSTLSDGGLNIKEFFLGTERNFFYLVIIVIGNQRFCGVAQQSQISADFTYSEKRLELRITVKDILIEWAKRCETVPNSTITMDNGANLTFEQYIPLHFSGLTSDVVLLGLPSNYLARLQPYGAPQLCYVKGGHKNAILDQVNISRWETFKELARGLGFNFEMYLNLGSEVTSQPEFIFNIFFVSDLLDEDAVEVDIIEHREYTTAPRMEWLYLKARHVVFAEGEYAHGIFFNSLGSYDTDTNMALDILYPTLFSIINGKVLRYINASQITEKTILRDVDFSELELKQYNYVFPLGSEIGKMYPLDEEGVLSGGMAYSRIFNCLTVYNGIDHFDYRPIQKYAITNYNRYLKGLQKGKNLIIAFDDSTNIKPWRVININDGSGDQKYYISAINGIDLKNKRIDIDAVLLN